MQKIAILLSILLLSACKTIVINDDMVIRSDAVTKAKPLAEQSFGNGTEITVQRPDGAMLRGVLVTRPDAERTLLYFGGNLFHLDESGKHVLAALASCKVNVAMFDYRGYGRSKGAASVERLHGDALAIYDMLETRFPGKVAVHGQSMGSFVAASVAQQRAVRAVVLETTATTALETVQNMIPWYYKPFVSLSVAPSVAAFDNESAGRRFQSPTLVLAGGQDKTTPAYMSQRVFNAVPLQRKQLLVLPEAGHNNVLSNPSTAPALCPFIEA